MLTIIDVEWFRNGRMALYPTQLAAVKVTPDWEERERFSAVIRPPRADALEGPGGQAFRGHARNEIIKGSSPTAVFKRFFKWLGNDLPCVWDVRHALALEIMARALAGRELRPRLRIIRPGLARLFDGGGDFCSSPFRTCENLRLPVHGLAHCAMDEAQTVLGLLYELEAPAEAVRRYKLTDDAQAADIFGGGGRREAKRWYLDRQNGLAHAFGCPLAAFDSLGIDDLIKAVEAGAAPCRCCREEFRKAARERTESTIARTKFNFIYADNGRLFHRAGCMHALSIPYTRVRGNNDYGRCIELGLKPCGWCRPKPLPKPAKKKAPLPKPKPAEPVKHVYEEQGIVSTRRLTEQEKRAFRRHSAAVRERARLDFDSLSVEEQRDANVLTQPGYAFWAARGYSTFHLRSCPKLNGLSDLKGFATFGEAARAGLRPCKLCKPSSKHDIPVSVPIYQTRREGETPEVLNALCDACGYTHETIGSAYYIVTPVGKWKLITDTVPVDVYHINLATPLLKKKPILRAPGDGEDLDSEGYHRQPRLFLSLEDTFRYIRKHEHQLMLELKAEGARLPNQARHDIMLSTTERSAPQ